MPDTPTPIAELVDYCRSVNTRLNAIGFDPGLDPRTRRKRAGAVMDEFLGLADGVCAAYAARPDSQCVFKLVARLRRRMSRWTKLTGQSPNDLDAKSGAWVEAAVAVKEAWLKLDGLRGVRPGDTRRDERAKGKGRGAGRKRKAREAPTDKQMQAYATYLRVRSIRRTADELGISYEAARKRVNGAKALLAARGGSVRTRRLPTDQRGQVNVPD